MEIAKELRQRLRVSLSPENYKGPERSVVEILCSADRDLQRVLEMIPDDEVLQFLTLFTGEGSSRAADSIIKRVPIEGSHQLRVKIAEDYVPEFIQGELRSINVDDSNDPTGDVRAFCKKNPPRNVELTHWQVMRGFCYYIAAINLAGAENCIRTGHFHSALHHIASALKQIGAASVRSIDEIEQAAFRQSRVSVSKKGATAKHSKLDPVREHALKLANEKPYPSRRQAVLAIKKDVIAYAKSLGGISMSADQAEKTIDGWLAKAGFTPSASKQCMRAS